MPNSNKRYIGITLGPISQTIAKSEKTREVWAASYLFSYLSRKLLEAFKANGFRVLNPSPEGLPTINLKPGVGLYSDRIFLLAEDTSAYEKVLQLIAQVKTEFCSEIKEGLVHYRGLDPVARSLSYEVVRQGKVGPNGEDLPTFLNQYFQVYSVEMDEAAVIQISQKVDAWFNAVNTYLDHLELRPSCAHFDPDPIKVFLRAVNHTFLLKDAFKRKHFDSLIEIATNELRFIKVDGKYVFREQYDDLVKAALKKATDLLEGGQRQEPDLYENSDETTQEEEELLNQIFKIENINNYLKTYHKYVAIVRADADRLGSYIATLSESGMEAFTKALLDFSRETNQLIAGLKYTHDSIEDWGYGGSPVYIGGDDLLFFAPVASIDGQGNLRSIFHLIRDIDTCFKNHFGAFSTNLSLSFGVAITYLKFPLQEGLSLSGQLLSEIKSNSSKKFKSRNRINFRVQKHGGQDFGGIINKNFFLVFKDFLELIDAHGVKPPEGKAAEKFVNSITHELGSIKGILEAVALDHDRLQAFFDKNFDEPIHTQYRDYLNAVCLLIHNLFREYLSETDEQDNPTANTTELTDTVYGLLRFIHFVRDNEFK
jgi:CRISPR-associated protein Cmr2